MAPRNEMPVGQRIAIGNRILQLRSEIRRVNNQENNLLERLNNVNRNQIVTVARILANQQFNRDVNQLEMEAETQLGEMNDLRAQIEDLRREAEQYNRELDELEREVF